MFDDDEDDVSLEDADGEGFQDDDVFGPSGFKGAPALPVARRGKPESGSKVEEAVLHRKGRVVGAAFWERRG